MAYLALYRKFRPKNFDQVVGQKFVTRILKNQILSGRIGHAYLFTGIRGTGKTSIAKIFARAINCTNNTDGNPCNACETCRTIEQAGVMDILEIDAASNRGVDEIREIRDKVVYPPKVGRYKVYIIDEVHMLTKEAFNALLKTLEEPPAHVVFVLATTEPNKLPATILSRCQRYDIRPITTEKITEQLQWILDDIGVAMEPEAVAFIAHRGDHSMRDALSILDQIVDIRQEDRPITYQEVVDYLGMTDEETVLTLVSAMLTGNSHETIFILNALRQKGIDSTLLMGQIIDALRELAIIHAVGEKAFSILGASADKIQKGQKILQQINPQKIFSMIDGLIEDRQKMRYSDMSALILEMALLKQCVPDQFVSIPINATPTQSLQETKTVLLGKKERKDELVPQPEQGSKIISPVEEKPTQPEVVKETASQEIVQEEKPSSMIEGAHEHKTVQQPEGQSSNEEEKVVAASSGDEGMLSELTCAIKGWSQSKDFLVGDMVSRGKLRYKGNGNYVMEFIEPDDNMFVALFTKSLQGEVCKELEKAAGRKVRFTVESVKKNFETMSFMEKTMAVVGDEYVNLIVSSH